MKADNIKLTTRMIILSVLAIASMIIIGCISILNMNQINRNVKDIHEVDSKSILGLEQVDRNEIRYFENIRFMIYVSYKNVINNILDQNEELLSENESLIEQFEDNIGSNEEQIIFSEYKDALERYKQITGEYVTFILNKDIKEATNTFYILEETRNEMRWKLDDLIKLNQQYAQNVIDSSQTVFGSSILKIAIVVVILVILLVLFEIFTIRSIQISLNRMKHLSLRLSNYDLTEPVELTGKDEFSEIGGSLNKAQENIRNLITTIIDSFGNIDASSRELSFAVSNVKDMFETINDSTLEISDGVQETSAAAFELSASIMEIETSVSRLSERAASSNSSAAEIKERAAKVEAESKEAANYTRDLYDKMEKKILQDIEDGKVVEEIRIMADTIADIAKQINLLSLNASIEAARAGEQGHGFAVVAGEVRALAEKSSETVQNVMVTIQKVQSTFHSLSDNSNELLNFMNSSVTPQFQNFINIGEQYEVDGNFVSTMSEELAGMSEELTNTIVQVSEAVQVMSERAQSSSLNLNDIQDSLNDSSDAMNQIADTASGQSKLSKNLNDIIGKFRV